MAVVFISPKQRQKMFFMAITVMLALFLAVFSAFVFFAPAKNVQPQLVFNQAKININTAVFDTDQFKELEPFDQMQMQFTYSGFGNNSQKIQGFISAASEDEALKILKDMGYASVSLKETEIGRENPFVPYYEIIEEKPETIIKK